MRLAIITIAIGEHYQRLSALTHPTIRRYADRIGADFIAITEGRISETTPHWEKFQLLDFLFDYDRILYVDTDVLIRKNCPNIFDAVPETHLGIYNEAPFVAGRDYAIERCAEAYDAKDFKWDGKYYNTGVMVLSRRHRMLLRKPEKEIFNFYEQSYLNLVIQRMKPQVFEIDYKFNRMSCVDKVTGKNRFESHIIHYTGVNYSSNGFGIIQNDLSVIESLPDDYVSPKHIWINVQGGLGDQIAGTFDNWIILIPTCKHPDHLLPYRNGSKSYKTRALYKKLALDDMMTSTAEMTGSSADKLSGKWEDYLPDVSSVLQTIQSIKNSRQ